MKEVTLRKDWSQKSLFFEQMTPADIKIVRLLIEYRFKYDSYFYDSRSDFYEDLYDIQGINENAILMYKALDSMIENCNFSDEQIKIVGMLSNGYELKEIAREIGVVGSQTVRNRFNTICRHIVERNLYEWRKMVYTHILGLKTKTCAKCKKELPGTVEFYSSDHRNKDGFQGRCRDCKT